MTTRDRLVVMVLAVLAVLAGGWMLLVSPERKHGRRTRREGRERAPAARKRAGRRDQRARRAGPVHDRVQLDREPRQSGPDERTKCPR